MAERTFKAGEIFFRAGDPGDFAYLINSGEVELLSGPPDNLRQVTRFGPKEVFGDMSLIEERSRALTARALTAGVAQSMSRPEFERLLTEDPEECVHYLKSLFERLRTMAHRQEPLAQKGSPSEALPVVTIHAQSKRAEDSLPPGGFRIPKFPFRIGRASEADEPEPLDLNDMWLIDSFPFNVSRNHLMIEMNAEGEVMVADRGSHLGTLVNDQLLGRTSPVRHLLLERGSNVVIVGSRESPYQFRVVVEGADRSEPG
jgi:CRP/FNR family transcriptional regulator, cyclic AMP receptor protein